MKEFLNSLIDRLATQIATRVADQVEQRIRKILDEKLNVQSVAGILGKLGQR